MFYQHCSCNKCKLIWSSKVTELTIGWDIGGAHMKAVLLDHDGQMLSAVQQPCPLWMGLEQLTMAANSILKSFTLETININHTITMTGELVDLFSDRETGVKEIAQYMANLLQGDIWFYQITDEPKLRFLQLAQVAQHAHTIASANWHASATWLAKQLKAAILVDIGSTTTDIIAIKDAQIKLSGTTDAQRMQLGSLIYTGVVRTPVMAVSQILTVDNNQTHIAAEHFATMADVYRLTEELPENADMSNTADGADKSMKASAKRLARMVGHDLNDKSMDVWRDLAHDCRDRQINFLSATIRRQIEPGMTIIGAGAGVFLVEVLAKQLGHEYQTMDRFLDSVLTKEALQQVITCFPAYAVAQLFIGCKQ